MSVSETNTPASTSTSVTATEEKNAPTQAEVVRKYKTKELIDFLRKEEDLELSEKVFKILEKQEVNGRDFLKTTKEEFLSYGMPGGPAKRLADFAKKCKDKKLKAFSSYRSLKEVLKNMALTQMVRTPSHYFLYKPTKLKTPTSTSSIAWRIFCSG